MSARDCVKQTATATGAYAFTLDGETAEDGFLLFRNGFQVPNTGQVSGSIDWFGVPVRIDVTSGASAGKWQLMYATLNRSSGDVLTVTGSASSVFANSEMGNAAVTPLAIAASDTAIVSVVPPGYAAMNLKPRPGLTDLNAGPDTSLSFGGTEANRRADLALLAVGANALALGAHSVAIGDLASTNNVAGYSLGYRAGTLRYGGVVGGHRAYNGMNAEFGHGMGDIKLLQGGANASLIWNMSGTFVQQVATTDATPTPLKSHDPVAWVSGDTPVLGYSKIYVDAGVMVVRATLVATNPANNDTKIWDVDFAVETLLNYSDTVLRGTFNKTVRYASAGAAAWDCALTVNSGSNDCSIDVTGAAATEIVWRLRAQAHYAIVY